MGSKYQDLNISALSSLDSIVLVIILRITMKLLFFLTLSTIVSCTVVQAQQCDDLMDPVNGTVMVSKTSNLFSAEYSCSEGFALVGHSIRFCNPNPACGSTQWLPSQAPKCEGIERMPVQKMILFKLITLSISHMLRA